MSFLFTNKGETLRFAATGKRQFALAMLLCCLAVLANAQNSPPPDDALKQAIDLLVQPYINTPNSHALTVGIIKNGRKQVCNYGQLDRETNPQPPTAHTQYRIGSLTKTFTAGLLAVMENKGVVNAGDPAALYLPDSVNRANPTWQHISLGQLASHTSGLPPKPYNLSLLAADTDDPYANYGIGQLFAYLMQYQPKLEKPNPKRKKSALQLVADQTDAPNEFRYSHLGIGLLGHLLEKAGGESYEALLQQHLLQPLKLNDTGLQPNNAKNAAPGHHFTGKPANPLHFVSLQASEALWSSGYDLLEYTEAFLLPPDEADAQPQASLAQCLAPVQRTPMPDVWVGCGWYMYIRGKKNPVIYTHSGRTGGYSNYIAFCPDLGVAVVLLSNSAERIDETGIGILEHLIIQK